jgi:hypothetical protein
MPCLNVDLLLLGSEQIEQQGSQLRPLQNAGYEAVPRA